jgi:uncharacterized protein (DUF2336 family)
MVKSDDVDLSKLMALSRDTSKKARRNLFENMGDLFLGEEDRLSEQERAHISDIMTKLIRDVELSVRITLAEKLTHSDHAPLELVTMLANDEIEVARPLLVGSRVLMEKELLEIIEYRSKEHLLCVTEREDISPLISDMLIEYGDDDIIEELVRNKDAQISKEALALLVEESKRVDRFQEPLLSRHDLPPALAHKMFWWVSAALRRHILDNFQIDGAVLDQSIALATTDVIEDPDIPEFGETYADRLAAHLAAKNELNEKTLIQTLRSKQIRLFLACFSIMSGLDTKTLSRFVHDKNSEAMAVVCKALGFDRNSFSAVFMLTRRGSIDANEGRTMMKTAEIEDIMEFFDSLKEQNAKSVLAHWKLDTGYTSAIEELDSKLDNQRVYL